VAIDIGEDEKIKLAFERSRRPSPSFFFQVQFQGPPRAAFAFPNARA